MQTRAYHHVKGVNSLFKMAHALYSSIKDIPFKVTGSCRSLVYREHGAPIEKCTSPPFLELL